MQEFGYQDQVKPKSLITKKLTPPKNENSCIHFIKPVPSQLLTVYQNQIPIHLDLDSGCWISTVKHKFAKQMKWKMHPNGQLASIADGKTTLKSIGEIHETFTRRSIDVP